MPFISQEIQRVADPCASAGLMAPKKGVLYNRLLLHLGWIQEQGGRKGALEGEDTGGNCVLHQLEHRGLITGADGIAGKAPSYNHRILLSTSPTGCISRGWL